MTIRLAVVGAALAPLHDAAVLRYREALNELFEAQTEIEQLMDARQMFDTPHENHRKHGRFAVAAGSRSAVSGATPH